MKYFTGNLETSPHVNPVVQCVILQFLKKYVPGMGQVIFSETQVNLDIKEEEFKKLFSGKNYEEDLKYLVQKVGQYGETLPPWFRIVLKRAGDLRVMETSRNESSGVFEIAVTFEVKENTLNHEPREIRRYAHQTRKMDYSLPFEL